MAWKDDRLNREELSQKFEQIASVATGENVFLVHAGFGMGKTFFAENWRASLAERGLPVVLFDAWRSDYLESPLAGFVSAMSSQLRAGKVSTQVKNWEKIKSLAKSAAPIIAKGGARVGLRMLSLGAIDGDIDSIREAIVAEGIASSEAASAALIDSFGKILDQEALHSEIRQRFLAVVSEILDPQDASRLYVFIDELDRCRPDFTFALLEDIKHFLGVPRVQFFIFCDIDVLQSQSAKIFGDKESGEKYISKFCNFRLKLPDHGKSKVVEHRIREMLSIPAHQKLDDKFRHLAALCESSTMSVRQSFEALETCMVFRALHPEYDEVWPVANVISILRTHYREEFSELENKGRCSLPTEIRNLSSFEDLSNALNVVFATSDSLQIFYESNEGAKEKWRNIAVQLIDDMNKSGSSSTWEIKRKYVSRLEYSHEAVYERRQP